MAKEYPDDADFPYVLKSHGWRIKNDVNSMTWRINPLRRPRASGDPY